MDRYSRLSADLSRSYVHYDSVTIDISGSVSDFDVKASTLLFDNVRVARELTVRITTSVGIKINSTNNATIDLFDNDGLSLVGFPVENLYISTSSEGSIIRIVIIGYN